MATLPGIPLYAAFGFAPKGEQEDILLADGVPLACLAMSKAIEPRPDQAPLLVGLWSEPG